MCDSVSIEPLGPALVRSDVLSYIPTGASKAIRWKKPGSLRLCLLQSCQAVPPSQGHHIRDRYARIKMVLGKTTEIWRYLQKLSCNL